MEVGFGSLTKPNAPRLGCMGRHSKVRGYIEEESLDEEHDERTHARDFIYHGFIYTITRAKGEIGNMSHGVLQFDPSSYTILVS